MTSPQINAEQLRLYYLQQLGIAAYMPRGLSAVNEVVVAELVTQTVSQIEPQTVLKTVPQTVPQQDHAVMDKLVTSQDVPLQAEHLAT